MSEANLRDKALFLYRMRELKRKWDAEDRKEIGELRREYYKTDDETVKAMIKDKLRIVFGVEP